jgi:hypothetical protein
MPCSHATFLPWRGWVRVPKIAALRERVIGRERPHISVVWNIARMGRVSSFDLRMMDGSG